MRAEASRVRVRGPLAELAPGFAEELSRLGYTQAAACRQLRMMAHLSRWMGTQGLGPTDRGPRLMRLLAARRSAGHTRWVPERCVSSLIGYLVRACHMPAPEPAGVRCRSGPRQQ